MKINSKRRSILAVAAPALLWLTGAGATRLCAEDHAQWKFAPGLGIKEMYDDNVFLQNRGDLAHRDSMVSTVSPSLGATWNAPGDWRPILSLKYAPDFAFYHSESGEDYISHNVSAALSGKSDPWSFDLAGTASVIDGDHFSPTFAAPGAIPAMGGIALRDRRDAAVYKISDKVQYTSGDWLVRPVFSANIQDFQTVQRDAPGYENYVDRSDMNGGIDVGYLVVPASYFTIGYRYGAQHQAALLESPIEFSNTYHRLLLGFEGKPVSWLKLSLAAGPDFRSFNGHPTQGFDDEQVKVFVDSSLTVMPTKSDELTLLVRRFLQPSYCGRAVYEDITYQLSYRHEFTRKLSTSVSFRDYQGDWEDPSTRNDVIYTASVAASYSFDEHMTAELGYSFDRAESNVPDTFGREFTRNLVWAGLRYSF